MQVITTNVYTYDELDAEAKEKAREWYLESGDTVHYGFIYNDAENVAKILGIEIARRGTTSDGPCIWWSGFSSQGDGACFEGSYRFEAGCQRIRDYAPRDEKLHSICDELAAAQAEHQYKLRATVKQQGHYNHSGCTDISVWHEDDLYRDIGDAEEKIAVQLRRFMDWIYDQLEKEYEYQTSEEAVAEVLCANEYTFTAEGKRFG